MTDLETVRAAFRAASLADGAIESFADVGPELLWQVAELREIVGLLSPAGGDDKAQGTHYVDKAGVIRCNVLETIEKARKALKETP